MVAELSAENPETDTGVILLKAARNDLPGCSRLVEQLIENGAHPIQISHFLAWATRTLLANCSGASSASLHKDLKNYYVTKQIGGARNAFSEDELSEGLEILKLLDFRLKDSALPAELALHIAVDKMAMLGS